MWAVTWSFVIFLALKSARLKLASGLIALTLAAPGTWLLHNWTHSSKVTIMSSYDGENAFRGWNAHILDLYPDCTLDLLFGSVTTCGTRTMQFPSEPRRGDSLRNRHGTTTTFNVLKIGSSIIHPKR